MRFALCNEIFKEFELEKQFRVAAELGFDALEVAPFTLADWVQDITPETRREIVRLSSQTGVEVVGLHWLLVGPTGLHATSPDPEVRKKTIAYVQDLVRFGVEIGGKLMVVGSPQQRNVLEGVRTADGIGWFCDAMAACADLPEAKDFTICIEPLYRGTANFLNTAADGRALADRIGRPNVRVILDCYSMWHEEDDPGQSVRDTRDHLAHVHVNDNNKRAPGCGDFDFGAVFDALLEIGYDGHCSIEVFDFDPEPIEHARMGLAHLKAELAKAQERAG